MVNAKRVPVVTLLEGARSYLQYCSEHSINVPDESDKIVARAAQAVSSNDAETVAIDQVDLSALYELSKLNERVHSHRFVKLCQTHVVASWLAALPIAFVAMMQGSFEAILLLVAAPLLTAFLVYLYLPLRVLSFGFSILLSCFSPLVEPRFIDGDDLLLFFAISAALFLTPLLWPSWYLVRQFQTGRRCPSAWIATALLLLLDAVLLCFRAWP